MTNETPTSEPKLPNIKAIVAIAIALIAVGTYFAIALLINIWPFQRHAGEELNPSPASTQITSQLDTSNWKVYQNQEYGFEFKYPNTWKLQEYEGGVIFGLALDPKKTATQKEWETLDQAPGLISIIYNDGRIDYIIGSENFKTVSLGASAIRAKYSEYTYTDNAPNGTLYNTRSREYYIEGTEKPGYLVISVRHPIKISDNLELQINSILSTFKFF